MNRHTKILKFIIHMLQHDANKKMELWYFYQDTHTILWNSRTRKHDLATRLYACVLITKEAVPWLKFIVLIEAGNYASALHVASWRRARAMCRQFSAAVSFGLEPHPPHHNSPLRQRISRVKFEDQKNIWIAIHGALWKSSIRK